MKKLILLINSVKKNKFIAKCTLKLCFSCAIYFTCITHSIGQVQEQQVVFPTQSVHSIDGISWASGIGNNFITGSQYWVYINPNLEAIVARKSSNGTITTKVLMQNVQNNDNHAEFSLGVDNEGYIHVIGGQHNSSPQYFVSKNPDDISSFEFRGNDLSLGGLQGTQMTYQSFTRSNKGTLFVTYRNNVVEDFVTGARSLALARYDTKSKKWTMIGGKNYQVTNSSCQTITGEQAGITAFVWNNSGVGDMRPAAGKCFSQAHYQAYQLKIKFDQNNGMHASYNMADSINMTAGLDVSKFMTHLFYAYSPDEGNTWFKANGNQITAFPITKATGDLVYKSIPAGYVYPATTSTTTMPNSCATILDKDGLPIIVQSDYITNSTLMFKWSGTSWVNQTSLTNRGDRFYTDLSKKIIYNFGSSQQFQMSTDNMATFINNVTMVNPAAWYLAVDDYYLTKTRNVMYYARNETLSQATIMNMIVSSPDALAPAAPAGLFSSEIAQNRITLNWTASSELDVCRYEVYNNGSLVGSTGASYYTISGLSPSTSYTFTVKAVDGSENVSALSTALTVSTSGIDIQLPVIPAGLSATEVTGSSFKLNWNAATDNIGVVSYEIYKDDVWLASTAYTSYHVMALSAYTTHGMSVRAKDAAGNLSSLIVLNVKTYGSGLIIFEPYNYTIGTTNNDPDAGINGGSGLPPTNAGGKPTGTGTGLRGAYTTEASVVAGLTYLNLETSGGAQNITNATWGGGLNPYRFMTTDPFLLNRVAKDGNFGIDGQSLYFSFIAKTSSSTAGSFSFVLGGTRNVYIENTATGWTINDNKVTVAPTSATLQLNTATLLVVKIDFNAGAADVVSLYKNPPIDGTLGSPAASLTVGADFTIGNFNTRPNVANAMTMDEFRMGISYADVTPSTAVAANPPDTESPTVPTGLAAASVTTTSATISWVASTDNIGVTGYEIFSNGASIGTSTGTSFNITGLSASTTYAIMVRARDAVPVWSDQSTALNVTTAAAPSVGTGNVTQEIWINVTGSTLNNFPTTTPNSTVTLTSLEIASNLTNNYATRIRGYIIPTTTGNYTFYIACDDAGQLSLSTNDLPANATIISSSLLWTNPLQWNKYPSQQSTSRSLTAGVKYYFEALMKEGAGGDNLAIGWTGPGISVISVIGAANLDRYIAPTGDTQAPTVPTTLTSSNITSTSFTVNWTASTDNVGVTGYEVFRNGTSIGTPTGTSFNVTGLTASTAYIITVRARDAVPGWSDQSTALNVTTAAAPVADNLGFESDFTSWTTYGTASINTTAANVRSGTKAGFFSNGGGNYTITGLTPGASYNLRGWIKAVSGSGNWITASNFGGTNTGLSSSSTAWTQTGNIIFTMGATNTTATVATYTDATSSAYFDDFTVTPYTAPPTGTAINIAPTGVGNIWSDIPSATSTSDVTKSANTVINDGTTAAEVGYNDAYGVGNWQAAGVVWGSTQKSITSIKLFHGFHAGGSDNGCFTANIKVQQTLNGTTWTDVTGWTVSPTYPYSSATSNQTYTLSGPKIVDARGVRVVGQVRTNEVSYSIKVRELEVWGSALEALASLSSNVLKLKASEILNVGVYPNPAKASFTISTSSENAKITVTSPNGIVVKVVNANTKITTIDSGNWTAGIYIIQIQTGLQITITKVLITR